MTVIQKSKPPTREQIRQRRKDLPAYLGAIRRQALYGARAADGLEADVHQHLMAIVAHVDDATAALNKSRSDRARWRRDDELAKADHE